jgi:hypothetical protein
MEYYWGDNRRFNSYAGYFKRLFGGRVQKLTIDAGFTCPNRDGSLGVGGCTYCNNNSFNPSYCNPSKTITQQIEEGIVFHENRYRRAETYLAYFQAYSNTYAPLETLRKLYDEALMHPKVIGLVIGTRPDCVDNEKLDYLAELAKNYYVSVEYGVETSSNETLQHINRGHTFEQSVWAIEQTAHRSINVGAHFIIGLPGQSEKNHIELVNSINNLPLTSIKFHQLQIIRNTHMEVEFAKHPEQFKLFTLDEYLLLLCRIVERMNPAIVIERITSESPPPSLIAPQWGNYRTDQLLIKFEKMLLDLQTWQGRLFQKEG